MEFKNHSLISIGLLVLLLCPVVNADSGRPSSAGKSSSPHYNSLKQRERNEASSYRTAVNTQLDKSKIVAQQQQETNIANSQALWFRNLCIVCLVLTFVGMGLAIYSFRSRAKLLDVTEKLHIQNEHSKNLQKRITDMQRIESLGMLAGGVAHDFNNLLVGVLCNAELLQNETQSTCPDTDFERERIDQIIQSAEKAADLSKQMLAYAGKTQIVKVPAELNSIISRIQSLLVSTAGQHTNLELDLSPDAIVANVDATQIEQILLNLVSNASQAVGGEGEIIIRTGSEYIESLQTDDLLFGTREIGGQFVYFEVHDSGVGISPEKVKHIFDPFYTSREDGRGLGLAVVFGFVKSHDGLIRATTTPGEGTCFRILLPASASAIPEHDFEENVAISAPIGSPLLESMTVLVVDDEPGVRNTAKALLESIGWKVCVARSGMHALQVIEHATFNIDCVLLDVVMPQMGAKEVLEQIKIKQLDVCVVLMSGNSHEQLDPYRQKNEVAAVLAKPFKTQELVETISNAVKNRSETSATSEPA